MVKDNTTGDEEADLQEEEIAVLKEAGLIAESSIKLKKRKSARAAPKHIVFVEDESDGKSVPVF